MGVLPLLSFAPSVQNPGQIPASNQLFNLTHSCRQVHSVELARAAKPFEVAFFAAATANDEENRFGTNDVTSLMLY